MNAIVKNDTQVIGHYRLPGLGAQNIVVLILLVVTIISAFAVICCRDTSRQKVSELQGLQQQNAQLKLTKNQLLAEQSALLSDQRVTYIAENKLHMLTPNGHAVIMVKS